MVDIKNYFKNKYKESFSVVPSISQFILFVGSIWLIYISNNPFFLPENLNELNNNVVSVIRMFPYLFGLTFVLSLFFIKTKEQIQGIISEFNIFNLKSDKRTKSKMSGAFFLGCGSISGSSEEIDYYIFFKQGRFGLIKDKIKAYDIEVIQRNDIKPSYKEIIVNKEKIKCLFVPTNTIKKQIIIN